MWVFCSPHNHAAYGDPTTRITCKDQPQEKILIPFPHHPTHRNAQPNVGYTVDNLSYSTYSHSKWYKNNLFACTQFLKQKYGQGKNKTVEVVFNSYKILYIGTARTKNRL